MALVEMSEEEIVRRWLAKSNLIAVDWKVMEALVAPQISNPIVAFDPTVPTYVFISAPASRAA